MPPNVLHSWDVDAAKRHYHDHPVILDDEDDLPEFNAELFLPSKNSVNSFRNDAKTLWRKILRKDTDSTTLLEAVTDPELFASLSSIVVLNDTQKSENWLNIVGGQLSEVSPQLLESLRKHAPDLDKMSTVADFNDNLLYHMQQERGVEHFPGLSSEHVQELESILQANEYLGSFLTTKSSVPQPAHVDYPWEVLDQHEENKSLKLGFFPLTEEGMFLQIWPAADPSKDRSIEIQGQIVFIPFGKLLMVPASTIHGGGFRTTAMGEASGNLRFHLYVATDQASLPAHQTNKYTERCDKTKEMSRRYVDAKHMGFLLEFFFV